MKKCVILSILLCLFSFAAVTNSRQQVVTDVDLDVELPGDSIPRSPAVVPISCSFSSQLNCLIISSSSIEIDVDVLIINSTSGSISNEEIYVSGVPSVLPLSGPGDYSVTIALSTGVTYRGYFEL